MAAKNFYDAVLIGLDLRTLLAGALLAKRGFRVLLVGQGQPWPSYDVAAGLRFARAPFSLTSAESPVMARVFSEIALRPLIQRRARPLTPAFQAVMPGHRFDLSRSTGALQGELAREFPDARRFAEELWHAAQLSSDRLDHLLERDLMWPPEGFFEKREFARASLHEPFAALMPRLNRHELANDHAFVRVLDACAGFADGSSIEAGYGAHMLRLLAARLASAELLEGGLSGLYELLLASIRTHNGSVRLNERVDAITVRRSALASVHLLPSDEEIGCHFLLWGLPVARLGSLLHDRNVLDPLFGETGEPSAKYARYTLNLSLRAEALPEGMGRDVLLLGKAPLWIETQRGEEQAVMSVETLLPAEGPEERARRLATQRETMLEQLHALSPFLREHILLVDSPHDGRPIEDHANRRELAPNDPFTRGPDTMRTVYSFPRTRLHGIAALTVRTPLKRVLLCNDQVVPGLGVEGAFVTAWSAARAVTRALPRGWMNRGRWTKVEL